MPSWRSAACTVWFLPRVPCASASAKPAVRALMAPSKHLLVAAGVATIAVGAAWYLSSRRRRAPKAAASPKAAKPPCCKGAAPAEKPEAAAAPQLTEEEQRRMAAMQAATSAKERGNKRFQGRQYQLVRVP